jgi:PTH2 family peptidyl-tRNA hydrolase
LFGKADYETYPIKIEHDLYEQWLNGEFTKCVLQAKNKSNLLKAKTLAEELGMKEGEDFFLIRDNCHTELTPEEDGRTLTCIGFKPMPSEIIDQIGRKFHMYIG